MTNSHHEYEVGDELPIDGTVPNRKLSPVISSSVQEIPEASPASEHKKTTLHFAVHLCLFLLQTFAFSLFLLEHGLPVDVWTGACLSIYGSGLALVGLTGESRFYLVKHIVSGLILISLILPSKSYSIMDVRGGREGILVLPLELRFGGDGPNTKLLEKHLGTLEPEWRQRFSLPRGSRGGYERVHSLSLIYSVSLPKILLRLPNTDARQQVLACLTDSKNLLRVHQGLLLAALEAKGYPDGYEAGSWWKKHQWFFVVEDSALRATYLTDGWARRFNTYHESLERERSSRRSNELARQVSAAKRQEGISRGGEYAFREGRSYLKTLQSEYAELLNSGDPRIYNSVLGRLEEEFQNKKVVWWP